MDGKTCMQLWIFFCLIIISKLILDSHVECEWLLCMQIKCVSLKFKTTTLCHSLAKNRQQVVIFILSRTGNIRPEFIDMSFLLSYFQESDRSLKEYTFYFTGEVQFLPCHTETQQHQDEEACHFIAMVPSLCRWMQSNIVTHGHRN